MRINPRNFYPRKLDVLPPHFVKFELKNRSEKEIDSIARWVYKNCYGRFGITTSIGWKVDQPTHSLFIGFEEPTDLTLFSLSDIAHKRQIV